MRLPAELVMAGSKPQLHLNIIAHFTFPSALPQQHDRPSSQEFLLVSKKLQVLYSLPFAFIRLTHNVFSLSFEGIVNISPVKPIYFGLGLEYATIESNSLSLATRPPPQFCK